MKDARSSGGGSSVFHSLDIGHILPRLAAALYSPPPSTTACVQSRLSSIKSPSHTRTLEVFLPRKNSRHLNSERHNPAAFLPFPLDFSPYTIRPYIPSLADNYRSRRLFLRVAHPVSIDCSHQVTERITKVCLLRCAAQLLR